MDLAKILEGIEGSEELIKKIELAIGKEYVPRSDFNEKNEALKAKDAEYATIKAQLDEAVTNKNTLDQTIAELTGKVGNYELQNKKIEAARKAGLPYDLANRLTGDNEESLLEDARSLVKLIPNRPVAPPLKSTEPASDSKDAPYKALLNGIKGE